MTSHSSEPGSLEEPAVIAVRLYEQQRIRADYCEEQMWEAMAKYEKVCGELLEARKQAEAAVSAARNHRGECIHYEMLAEILGVVL